MKDTLDVAWTSRKIRTETCRLEIAGLLENVPWERLPWGGGNRNQAVTGRVSSVRSGDVETGKATFCEGFWVEGGRQQESRAEEGWGRDSEGRGSALRWQGGEGGAPSDSFLVFFFSFWEMWDSP